MSPEISLVDFYSLAREKVISCGFLWEIDWQKSRNFELVSETEFLREASWVILCSGFKESIVRKKFDFISLCFYDWESAEIIAKNSDKCVRLALSGIANEKKMNSIIAIAEKIYLEGFDKFNKDIINDPITSLEKLPFIGKITSWHLAKNLGIDVAKNDRHLQKIALFYGYSTAHELCQYLSIKTREKISVIDVILWRYASLIHL